jgi:cyclophilin family peptidyl-prolyl cis-trans isomerase
MKFSKIDSVLLILIMSFTFTAQAQIVRMKTVLGDIDIELNPTAAPNTVANFLEYVNGDDYDDTFVHRVIPNFIIQGGIFKFSGDDINLISSRGQIDNEYSLPNTRGTISMAKLNNQPDSATSSWFINTIDNTNTLGPAQNEGFTVFGDVISGMDVVDAISALDRNSSTISNPIPIPAVVGGNSFTFYDLPYLNDFPNPLTKDDLVIVSDIIVLDGTLNFNAGLSGAWFNSETSGSGILLEVLETTNIVFMAWFTHDAQTPVEGIANTIGSTNQRWLTGIGTIDRETNSVTLDLANTSGGLFDNPQSVTTSAPNSYGTMTISFADCSNANVVYNLIDQELSGAFSMGRLTTDNVALCETLSQAAAR